MKDLPHHESIIKLVEYNWEGVLKKGSGETKEVLYVVLEYAEGGDLFDYVFTI